VDPVVPEIVNLTDVRPRLQIQLFEGDPFVPGPRHLDWIS
jgi:hypothetical protein